MKTLLVLEDGWSQEGSSFTGEGEVFGEIVFNTGLTGYQEVITDPSYAGQIVLMTAAMIGTYGIRHREDESLKIYTEGFIVKEYGGTVLSEGLEQSGVSPPQNNRHMVYDPDDDAGEISGVHNKVTASLADYLSSQNVLGLEGVDTRALTRHIREKGAMRAGISTRTLDREALLTKVLTTEKMLGRSLVQTVSAPEPYLFSNGDGRRITVMDYGVKKSTLQQLAKRGCRVEVLPASATEKDIFATRPEGMLLSNGPGDPAALPGLVSVVENLLGKVPIFGICLGHQIVGRSLGLKTFKLPFGRHGCNHPVKDECTGKVYITTQNHGFAVDTGELTDGSGAEAAVSFVNLNDRTNEGLTHSSFPLFSVQFHPEAGPGPHDSLFLFDRFLDITGGF